MTEPLGVDQIIAKCADLSPKGMGIGLHIRFGNPHMRVHTYDPRWSQIYIEEGYMAADPIIFWSFSNDGARRWSEVDIPDPRNVMGRCREFGINYGVIISTGPFNSRSIAGFAREDREFTDDEIKFLQEMFEELHNRSAPPERLTPAQRMALRLVAGGSRHAEAAARLGISESAFKARLTAAREKLRVRTTAEAIQRAQEYSLL